MFTDLSYFDVEVTQEDIDNGRQGNVGFCPIALACKRKFGIPYVYVSADILFNNQSIATPEIAKKFIRRFDAHRQHLGIGPFKFNLLEDIK